MRPGSWMAEIRAQIRFLSWHACIADFLSRAGRAIAILWDWAFPDTELFKGAKNHPRALNESCDNY
jgi:hypothetical protein